MGILDEHFRLQERIQTSYRDRDRRPNALDVAVSACEEQIAMAPEVAKEMRREYPGQALPRHVGFQQLAIIREKQGDIKGALRLSEEAHRQGWGGDFDKRIARLRKKLG